MATTKTTTPISAFAWRLGFIALAGGIGVFAFVNLFTSATPVMDDNARIAAQLTATPALSKEERRAAEEKLLAWQENLLAREPAEPFAWARLAWLRQQVTGDDKATFAALRLSDMVSPNEPRQQLERAFLWRELRDVEDADQQAYQPVLWRKAFSWQPGHTFYAAQKRGLSDEIGAALQQDDKLFEGWTRRLKRQP